MMSIRRSVDLRGGPGGRGETGADGGQAGRLNSRSKMTAMTMRPYLDAFPTHGERVYIDPAAVVIGDVSLGDDVSIWPGCVIRGDVNSIAIGARTNVQDGTIVHVTHEGPFTRPGGLPTVVANDVTVGHGVMHLRHQGAASAFEAAQDVELPERLRAVEHAGEDLARRLEQLGAPARRGNVAREEVAVQVEPGVALLGRVPEIEGSRHHLLHEAGQALELGSDRAAVGGGIEIAVEDRDRADVHRRVLALGVEEGGVGRAQHEHAVGRLGRLGGEPRLAR